MLLAVLAAAVWAPSAAGAGGFVFGFAEDLPKEIGAGAVAPAKSLGAGAFRLTLQWSRGQTALTSTDTAKLDRAIAASSGVRVVLAVYGTSGDAAPTDAASRDQYCGYVRAVLKRYPAIRDVVIWNEPNKSLFWRPQVGADGSPASPAAYEALLARCYDVLHGAFPGVDVLGLALSSTGNDDAGSRSPGDFIRRVGDAYRASGRGARILDTVAYHPYPAATSERPWVQHIGSKVIGQGDWNKLMYNLWLAFDGTAQPIPGNGVSLWYTEIGFQSTVAAAKAGAYSGTENVATLPDWVGGEPEAPAPAATSAAPDQGTQALDAIRLAACQPFVGAFFNFLLADEPILSGWQSGPLWADRTPKGSYDAFARAIAAATGGTVDCAALKGGRPSADFMPPSAPTNLTATAATSPLRVQLAWGAATDASAVSYRIYRNTTLIGTSSTTSWTHSSVTQLTTYTYTVRAIDSAGNLGDASPPVTVTTPDGTAPTAPGGLTALASQGPSRVDLAWTPSTDNVGVDRYEILRDGTLVGTAATTSFSDTGVVDGTTYSYAVVAVDASGNRSAAATARLTPGLLGNGGFEGTTAGWAPWLASLAVVPGKLGFGALRTTAAADGSPYGVVTWPMAVESTAAGSYSFDGWVRGAPAGRSVCVYLREWAGDAVVGQASQCVDTSSEWQQWPTVTLATAAGHRLDAVAVVWSAQAGDSFDLDGLTLKRS